MEKHRIPTTILTALVWVWLLAGLPSMADKPESGTTTGKIGTVTLTGETRVGHLVLQPGLYWVQFRVEGSKHFIHFTWLTGHSAHLPGVLTVKGYPGEAECQMQPLLEPASRTAVYTRVKRGTYRITRIEIVGENVAHVFSDG